MLRVLRAVPLAAALVCSSAAATELPSFVGKHEATPEDLAAILQVTQDFQKALKTKDIRLLSSLLVNQNILWLSPASPANITRVRAEIDPNYDGLALGGYAPFAEFVKEEKGLVEERFYNIRVTQDRHVAFVMFDFDFRIDDRIINHGVEAWQMFKNADGKWKIASVFWSSKGRPK